MSDKVNIKVGPGLSFGSLLTLIFITLKLIGTLSWPWLWVLAPLWIPLAIALAIVTVCLIMALIVALLK